MKEKAKRITRFLLTMILAVTAVLSGFVGTGNNAVKAEDTISGLDFTEEQVLDVGGSTYRFQAYWANVQSASTKSYNYDDDGTLVMHPISSVDTTEAQLGIKFSVEGEMIDEHPVGSITFRIPASVVKDWNGEFTGELSTQIPKAPETSGTSQFNYTIDEETGDIVISNWAVITGAMTFSAVLGFKINPFKVPGGWIENGNYAGDYYRGTTPVKVNIDLDGSGGQEMQQDLNIEYHTKVSGSVSKWATNYYYTWQSTWGEKPADASDYFYVLWKIEYGTGQAPNQPYGLKMEEVFTDGGEFIRVWKRQGGKINGDVFVPHPIEEEDQFRANVATENGFVATTYPGSPNCSVRWCALVRYPYTLVDEAIANGVDVAADGLIFTNTAEVTEYWKSGHTVTRPATGKCKIPFDLSGTGKISFRKTNYGGGEKYIAPGGAGQSFLQAGDTIHVNSIYKPEWSWTIVYTGTAGSVKWDNENDTYYDAGHTITIEEGDYQMSSAGISREFAWDAEHINLEEADYEIDGMYLTVNEWDANYAHGIWEQGDKITDLSRRAEFDVYIRAEGETEYTFYTHMHYGNIWNNTGYLTDEQGKMDGRGSFKLRFPHNTVSYKIVGHSDAYKINIENDPSIKLRATEHVMQQINKDVNNNVDTYIKNIAYIDDVNDDATVNLDHVPTNRSGVSAKSNLLALTRFTKEDSLVKESSGWKDDPVGMTQSTTEGIILTQKTNAGKYANDLIEKKGIVYDLLPYGTYFDPSSMKILFGNGNTFSEFNRIQDYSFELIDNWQGSGRTMLVIRYESDKNFAGWGTVQIGIWYRLYNPYSNIRDMGINHVDSVAYINDSDKRMGRGVYAKISRIQDAEYFQSLQEQYPDKIMYAEVPVNYHNVTVLQTGLTKSSKAQASFQYSNEDTVIATKPYDYQLSYTSLNDVKTRDIVLYDVLEAGNKEIESEWHGTFDYIDVSSIRRKTSDDSTVRCDPKIYYSTTPREQLLTDDRQMKDEYEDLTNPVWTDTEPADKSTITAIAVDCRYNTDGTDFILSGGSTMAAYLHMLAPNDSSFKGKKAVNSVYSETKSFTTTSPAAPTTDRLTNSAAMILDTYEPDISKEADPAGGTEDAPAQIETGIDLSYTIHLTNTSAIFPYKNAVVVDDVPAGMTIHTDQIKAYTDDKDSAQLVSEYEGITLTASGQHLEFLVDELKAGKSIHFIIPVTVTAEEGILKNTPVVKSIDDIELNIPGEPVVHEVNSKITIHIFKTDNAGTTPLPGAQFQLTGTETDITATTDEEGLATFEEIKTGEYTLKEIKSASGYQLSGTAWTVTVANGTATIKDPEGNVLGSTLNAEEEQVFHVKDGEPIKLLNTGGAGTGKFAFTGGILMLIAFEFIKKKRHSYD